MRASEVDVLELLRGGSSMIDTFAKVAGLISQLPPTSPSGIFEAGSAGPPPEFSQLESWLAHPGRVAGVRTVEDANHLTCAGSSLPPMEQRPCDCFFLVDSCYGTAGASAFRGEKAIEQWNLPLNAEGLAEQQLSAKVVEQMELRVAAAAS